MPDVALRLEPPAVFLLYSDSITDITIPGLAGGMIPIDNKAVVSQFDSMQGRGPRSRDKLPEPETRPGVGNGFGIRQFSKQTYWERLTMAKPPGNYKNERPRRNPTKD